MRIEIWLVFVRKAVKYAAYAFITIWVLFVIISEMGPGLYDPPCMFDGTACLDDEVQDPPIDQSSSF